MMKFLTLTLYFLARLTLILLQFLLLLIIFKKSVLRRELTTFYLHRELSTFLLSHVGHSKNMLFYVEIIAFQ